MSELDDARARARAAYNAASDHYDDEPLGFWSRYGTRTVERLSLKRGDRVLDVCCGSGASALPAAASVGPTGSVTGVDLAEAMLALAAAKAEGAGHAHTRWRVGDLMATGEAEGAFDAVVCVFGVFFVPDIPAAIRSLGRHVAPGGVLAVTTWGLELFEPGNTVFWDAVRSLRPELFMGFSPWARVATVETLATMMRDGGAATEDVVMEPGRHAIRGGEDFWTIAVGSGYRGTIDKLTPEERDHVHRRVVDTIDERGIREIRTDVVYARARF